jgi:DNA polymerase-3 subunit gamma/tau
MRGDVAAALARLKALYDVGADPAVVLEDLAAFTHIVTRLKLAASAEDDEALTEEEKTRGKAFAGKLSLRVLARAWQMLLKGIDEAKAAARPLAAADMVIVRIAHAADLPTPDDALKALGDSGASSSPRGQGGGRDAPQSPPALSSNGGHGGGSGGNGGVRMAAGLRTAATGGSQPAPQRSQPVAQSVAHTPSVRLSTFAELVALAGEKREIRLKNALETDVRLIRFEPGQIEISLTEQASTGLAGELSRKLEEWTGTRWMVVVGRDGTAPTIAETRKSARAEAVDQARANPLVLEVFSRFPGAEIVDVRVPVGEIPAAPSDENPDELPSEED